ncbi:MAG: hypothetical protein HFACDABA_00186 [Anaerolineales bacterium]|nr:hypothetical protein [Anaerolineales bacterium]
MFKFFARRDPRAALIAAGVLAFGLLIPALGFFQDDWHFIHYGSAAGGRGMLEFLTMDGRPTAAWVYATLYPLLGFAPLPWQVLSLTLRLIAVLLFFSTLTALFPNRTRANRLASFFFLLYPIFTLQPQAVVYTEHWISFALYFASLLFMLRALREPKRWLLFSALAILAETIHLFTVEYFVGLELLRPLIIWLAVKPTGGREIYAGNEQGAKQGRNPDSLQKNDGASNSGYAQITRRVALAWFPYLLVLLLFLYWRVDFLGSLGLRNNPADALTLQSILSALQNLPADLALLLAASWSKLVDPSAFELNRARNFVVLGITFSSAILAYIYTSTQVDTYIGTLKNTRHLSPTSQFLIPNSYPLSGILSLLLGLAPAYAANFIIHLKLEPWNGRFALAALPGAGMLAALAFESLFTSEKTRRVMFAILIGLLIGHHNRVAFDFKNAWEKQVTLYEQLSWRAPYIEPGTAVITDQEILGYMGDYPTSFALQTIYDTKSLRPSPYWFFAISENLNTDAASLAEGVELTAKKYASTFTADSRDSLIIVFEPEKNQCLWILRPEDAAYRGLPDAVKRAALVSNLSRIQDKHETDRALYRAIVPENPASWCFHYQRADLARQIGDWEQVVFFWELAERGGYAPGHGFEYIPFIQGYAHMGNWRQALALTRQSNRVSANMKTILCPVWQGLKMETPPSAERDSASADADEILGCQ